MVLAREEAVGERGIGMKAVPSRSHSAEHLQLWLPLQQVVLVLNADKTQPPSAAAASASLS